MLSAEKIQSMKQSNISANAQLTKERAKEVLKGATKEQKAEIDTLAGLKRVSINRVYANGSISAKVAVAIAQTLKVSPYYLIGEADGRDDYTDAILAKFLTEKGYGELVEQPAKRKPRRKTAMKSSKPKAPVQQAPAPVEPPKPVEQTAEASMPEVCHEETAAPVMSEADAVQLLQALYLRAKYNDSYRDTLVQIQKLLS